MKDLSFKSIGPAVAALAKPLRAYLGFFLFLLLALIYAFMVGQINKYSNPVVGEDEVLGELDSLPPLTIDKDAADKLKTLEDNSVNVQTLFREGRTNPFGE